MIHSQPGTLEYFTCESSRYARFPRLARLPGLRHAISTRPDDVSARADGQAAARAERRRRMARHLGLSPDRLRYCVQVHGPGVAQVYADAPAGPLESVDTVLTAEVGTPLMVFSADCPLVLAFDPESRTLGLAHASWRCTVGRASLRLIERMTALGASPRRVLAGIGPSAGPCCYEVQRDVWDAAGELPNRDAIFVERGGRLYFDLWQANADQLFAAGLLPENIEQARTCTLCANDIFYSFRREGAGCGHFGLMAAMVDAEAHS